MSKAGCRDAEAGLDGAAVELSVVVPMHNEEENVEPLFARLLPVLSDLGVSYEVVCVNDGSTDGTLDLLKEHRRRNRAVKVIDLSRNFGKEIALTAGIDHCVGRAVIPIDADLQDPPEIIPLLVEKWREGYLVVNATRRSRAGESFVKKGTATAFYSIVNRLTEITLPSNTGDFRLLDRDAVDSLNRLRERDRFMKGLFAWVGFRQATVFFDREARHGGATKWNYWRLWNFALSGITSFSSLPLKVWSYLGVLVSMFAFGYAMFLFVRVMVNGIDVPGYASLMVVTLFLGGVQLITLGVIGEYLSRIFIEVKNRPLYIIQKTFGIGEH